MCDCVCDVRESYGLMCVCVREILYRVRVRERYMDCVMCVRESERGRERMRERDFF